MCRKGFTDRFLIFALLAVGGGLGFWMLASEASLPLGRLLMILGPGLAVAGLARLWKGEAQSDLVPDFLGQCGPFFDRDGFCFNVSLEAEEGTAVFTVMFQSRFLGPAVAKIALRPLGSGLAIVSPEIRCNLAGFGVAKFPVAIPPQHQGKVVKFEIGADIAYPRGKGNQVRFGSGRSVWQDVEFRGAKQLFGLFPRRRRTLGTLTLPRNVASYLPEETEGEFEILWNLTSGVPHDRGTHCSGVSERSPRHRLE